MVHMWQRYCNGQASGGLIEGIADFVRLKENYMSSYKVKPEVGNRLDEGYSGIG